MRRVLCCILSIAMILAFFATVYAGTETHNCVTYVKAGDYQRVIESGKKAARLDPKSARAHDCLAYAYYRVGELDLALGEMKKAERFAMTKNSLAQSYNGLGQIYLDKGDRKNAMLYLDKYLSLAREMRDKRAEARALNNIAAILQNNGERDKALSYYEESLRLRDNEKDKAATYNNIATLYGDRGDHQRAVTYLKKSIDINERSGDYHSATQAIINLADVYRRTQGFNDGALYLREGLQRAQKIGDKQWEAIAYWYYGRLYRDVGEAKKGERYFTMAHNLFLSIGAQEDAQLVDIERDLPSHKVHQRFGRKTKPEANLYKNLLLIQCSCRFGSTCKDFTSDGNSLIHGL